MKPSFSIELAYSRNSVGIRIIAKSRGWSPSVALRITGDLTPADAIAFADALREKALAIAEANEKRDAADQRRQARLAKLPRISFR